MLRGKKGLLFFTGGEAHGISVLCIVLQCKTVIMGKTVGVLKAKWERTDIVLPCMGISSVWGEVFFCWMSVCIILLGKSVLFILCFSLFYAFAWYLEILGSDKNLGSNLIFLSTVITEDLAKCRLSQSGHTLGKTVLEPLSRVPNLL